MGRTSKCIKIAQHMFFSFIKHYLSYRLGVCEGVTTILKARCLLCLLCCCYCYCVSGVVSPGWVSGPISAFFLPAGVTSTFSLSTPFASGAQIVPKAYPNLPLPLPASCPSSLSPCWFTPLFVSSFICSFNEYLFSTNLRAKCSEHKFELATNPTDMAYTTVYWGEA